jgi:hypothetical protein
MGLIVEPVFQGLVKKLKDFVNATCITKQSKSAASLSDAHEQLGSLADVCDQWDCWLQGLYELQPSQERHGMLCCAVSALIGVKDKVARWAEAANDLVLALPDPSEAEAAERGADALKTVMRIACCACRLLEAALAVPPGPLASPADMVGRLFAGLALLLPNVAEFWSRLPMTVRGDACGSLDQQLCDALAYLLRMSRGISDKVSPAR